MSFGVNLQAQNFSDSIRGKVTCNGKGVQGVVVTDGIDCTLTDKQGNYAPLPQQRCPFCPDVGSCRIFATNEKNYSLVLSGSKLLKNGIHTILS
ncbi:metallophosphoesterase N-terminal domain-containing protein [Bacteroides faecis]|uniref:metallophosphoesterase N-terminal domain-containing protein n=1 Tax=Bacteroides faecis TaxID=674529 RepID=UPI0035B2FF86